MFIKRSHEYLCKLQFQPIKLHTYITLWVFGSKSSSGILPTRLSCTRGEVCFVKGIECVLYKYAMCIVQVVHIVLYRVYIVHQTGCAVCILHQQLVRKKRTLISNLIWSSLTNFCILETLDKTNIKRVYMFLKLCIVFLCSVQGVLCVLYNQPTWKYSINEEDFAISFILP